MATRNRTGVQTFAAFAADVLDEREHNGIRGIDQERRRFAKHLATAPFAGKDIDRIEPPDVAEWLRVLGRKTADDRRGKRALSRATQARCLSLASVIFDEAGPQNRGLIKSNPCLGMKVKKSSATEHTEDPWTFLTPEEQETLRTSPNVDETERLIVLFAIGTGLRMGEQFNLELRDLHVDGDEPHVFVRYGSKGKAPKSGKTRRVPLFGIGLAAAKLWLDHLPHYCPRNVDKLVFPTAAGNRRGQKPLGNGRFRPVEKGGTHVFRGKSPKRVKAGTHVYVDRFAEFCEALCIERNVRWHDLRHTCASSLVSGFWGEPWSLEEVKEMLGHSTIAVTQRYAHLGATALKRAAKKVRPVGPAGLEPATLSLKGSCATIAPRSQVVGYRLVMGARNSSESLEASEGLKGRNLPEVLRALAVENRRSNQLVTNLAATLAELISRPDV